MSKIDDVIDKMSAYKKSRMASDALRTTRYFVNKIKCNPERLTIEEVKIIIQHSGGELEFGDFFKTN